MDQLSFFKYNNRHIKFEYKGESRAGVVVDSIPYDEKEFPTQYIYIATKDMIDWKDAERRRDKMKMKRLEQKINLQFVENPQLLNH